MSKNQNKKTSYLYKFSSYFNECSFTAMQVALQPIHKRFTCPDLSY